MAASFAEVCGLRLRWGAGGPVAHMQWHHELNEWHRGTCASCSRRGARCRCRGAGAEVQVGRRRAGASGARRERVRRQRVYNVYPVP